MERLFFGLQVEFQTLRVVQAESILSQQQHHALYLTKQAQILNLRHLTTTIQVDDIFVFYIWGIWGSKKVTPQLRLSATGISLQTLLQLPSGQLNQGAYLSPRAGVDKEALFQGLGCDLTLFAIGHLGIREFIGLGLYLNNFGEMLHSKY